ncbi:purine phosphorylase [Parafrankia soli]|uniref:Purine phosphorylase n=1 Tax=Parafrankia soli TaxID=2599596 RepID=A0A1S1PKA6_9ACTN|nr:purine phosphorylase [Parafrankia soli]
MSRRPVVILTALDLEYQAIRESLVDPRLHRHDQGTRFELGRLAGGSCRIALAHVGKGTHPAAVLAERAIAEFAPAALLFVGVAGALHEHIALGDVVVATHVYGFHGGTGEDDGLKARPRVWETSHAADQIARHIHRTGSWAQRPGAPAMLPDVHFGPIAAGEVVLNSRVSGLARWIREHYNDALAIEMEGAGVAQAGHLNRALPVVVIRGVSDRADGTKESTDRQRWQQRAVANAALFATALAEEISAEDDGAGRPAAKSTKGAAVREYVQSVHNENSGSGPVGVQAHTVHGGVVHVTGGARPPVDLPTALAEIRARFQAARAAGAVDEDTYAAADAELAVAEEALEDGTPQSHSRLQLALKKFKGLVGDVSDLAAKVTIVLALARSLP